MGLVPKPRHGMVIYGGDGAESNRPATNFPGISVDTNRFDCLVEKSGLDVDLWRLVSRIKQV